MSRRTQLTALGACLLLAACGSTVQTRTTATVSTTGALTADQPSLAPGTTAAALDGSSTGGVTRPVGTSSSAPASAGGGSTGGGGSVVPSGSASLATSGIGWDGRSIYLGVSTEEDLSAAVGALGLNFNPGSIQGDVTALVNDINARGGVLGRKLVPVFHDNNSASMNSNPEAAAAENCADYTQDHHVVAVLNPVAPVDTDSFKQCLKAKHTPLFSNGYSTYDDSTYRRYGPYLWTALMPSVSRFVPSWVPHLSSAGYFGGWSATTGTASAAAPSVGIMEPDTISGHTIATLLTAALRKARITIGDTYFYAESSASYSTDMSSAILQFRSAGVTHLMDITNIAAPVLIFAETAQKQRYFPRYAMSSWLLPNQAASLFQQSGVAQQLNGAIGVGWTPGGDVNAAQDAPQTAVQKSCQTALAKGGQTFFGNNDRYALFVGYALCDNLRLLAAAMTSSGSLTPDALATGLVAASRGFALAATFSSALSSTNHALPGAYRVVVFNPSCTCFDYRGPGRPF